MFGPTKKVAGITAPPKPGVRPMNRGSVQILTRLARRLSFRGSRSRVRDVKSPRCHVGSRFSGTPLDNVQPPAPSTSSELPEVEPEHADDHGPEVTALIISEHGQLRVDMLALLHGLDPIDRRRRFQDLARNLLRHDTAEQEVIYPILARLEEGSELRSEALRQEQVIAADLTRLLRRLLWHPDGRKTRHRIEEFAGRLEQHHDFEEQSLLPVISVAEPKSTRQMMGTWTGYAESIAPTRPHPHGPQRLPGLMTFGLALSLMDRMRDRARRLISRRRERRR